MVKTKTIAIIFSILVLLFGCNLPNSENGDSTSNSDTKPVPSEVIVESTDSTGGTITIDDADSKANGLAIEIPPNTFSDGEAIEISVYDSNFLDSTSDSVVFEFENASTEYFNDPLKITLPISDGTSFIEPVVLAYDDNGRCSMFSVGSISDTEITYDAYHFSYHYPWDSVLLDKSPITPFYSFNDNAFTFGNDDLCYAMTMFIWWVNDYFNKDFSDIDFLESSLIDILPTIHDYQDRDDVKEIVLNANKYSGIISVTQTNKNTFKTLLLNLRNEKTMVLALKNTSTGSGHAVLVYGWDGDDFLVYDPNHPDEEQTLEINNGVLNYNSYDVATFRPYEELTHISSDIKALYDSNKDDPAIGIVFPTDDYITHLCESNTFVWESANIASPNFNLILEDSSGNEIHRYDDVSYYSLDVTFPYYYDSDQYTLILQETTSGLELRREISVFPIENPESIPPEITNITPSNGATNVSRYIDNIILDFSEPMLGGYSYSYSFPGSDGFWFDEDTYIIPVVETLQANTEYRMILNPSTHDPNFRDIQGNPLAEMTVNFTTGN